MKNSILNKILLTAVIVAVVGAGAALMGVGSLFPGGGDAALAADQAVLAGDVQTIESELTRSGYPQLVVKKGVPVRWNLKADANNLNSCNNALVIPAYGIEKQLQPGDNIIQFTPGESGTVSYSCWMGMIYGQIQVVDDLENVSAAELNTIKAAAPVGNSGGCCSAKLDTVSPAVE